MENEEKAPVTTSKKQGPALTILLIIIGMAIVGGVAVSAFRLGQSRSSQPVETLPTPSPRPEADQPLAETATPELAAEPTSITSTPTGKQKSDREKIKEAFAEKYSKPLDEVEVTISKNTGTHASGSVRFTGEMGGAMWLAYKKTDDWLIVFDGNGTIPCSAVDPHNFPATMAPECWNEATGKLITRD